MKKNLYLLLMVITLLSCSKTNLDKMCGVEDPVTEIKWLSNEIDNANANSQSIVVHKVVLKNIETKKKLKAIAISKISFVNYYDCSGNIIESVGGINPTSKFEEIKSEELYRNK